MNNGASSKNQRVLIIDDTPSIHDDFRKILSPSVTAVAGLVMTETDLFGSAKDAVRQAHFEVDSAYQGEEGVALIKKALESGRPYAMAFVDVRMPPGWDGVETIQKLWEFDPDLQIVLCTAFSDCSWGEIFEKIGHRDSLLILKKPFDAVEAFQLAHALTEKWWLHERNKLETKELETSFAERTRELQNSNETLQQQQTELQALFDLIPAMICFKDTENRILRVNKRMAETIGKSIGEIEGKSGLEVYPQGAAKVFSDDLEVIRSGLPRLGIVEAAQGLDGKKLWTETDRVPVCSQGGKVIGILTMTQDITARRRSEELLRLLSSAVEQSKESIVITDNQLDSPGPHIVFVNPAFSKMTGYTVEETIGKTPRILQGPRTDKKVLSRLSQDLKRGEVFEGETINYKKNGKEFHLEWRIAPIRNDNEQITHFVAIQHDITDRKRLEAQVFQAQKMDTVGKLAGGIAHEFNSILTAIIGQSEFMISDLPEGSPLAVNANEISKAADRAATLTRQLLAYGRKLFLQPKVLDLNRVVSGMESMLRHLLGNEVDSRIVLAFNLQMVKADIGQLEQVIMNMVINAREAMPNGGKLTVETANVTFDQEVVGSHPDLKPGAYVRLAITDTGIGMTAQVMARIFEPFFSTKDIGQGTGLGLSTCYGIIKQSGGHITVYSEPGRGATFKIYLPQFIPDVKISAPSLDAFDLPRGTETILFVEDDPALREMAATLLKRLGYRVLSAANGIEALSLKQQRGIGHIDLLFTDIVMPHMSGKELSDRMRALFPQTKILFTSAYTENAISHQGGLSKEVTLLQKPFTPSALARKLREVLDQPVDSTT